MRRRAPPAPGAVRRRSLRTALLYGLAAGGVLFPLARPLGNLLYQEPDAGTYLQLYAPLIPLFICGYRHRCHLQRTWASGCQCPIQPSDFFFWMWPSCGSCCPDGGLSGYFLSFAVTHLVNFLLSFRRLILVSGIRVQPAPAVRAIFCAGAAALVQFCLPQSGSVIGLALSGSCYLLMLLSLDTAAGDRSEDLLWLRGVLRQKARSHFPCLTPYKNIPL